MRGGLGVGQRGQEREGVEESQIYLIVSLLKDPDQDSLMLMLMVLQY